MHTHYNDKQASGGGMACKVLFLAVKSNCPATIHYKQILVIESIILVDNYWTDMVGSNQIQTVFDPEYERIVNLEGYDRISHYRMHLEDFNSDESDSD